VTDPQGASGQGAAGQGASGQGASGQGASGQGAAGDVVPLGRLVEMLTGDRADVASLSRVLGGALADALPAGVVQVEHARTMSDRLRGRDGTPISVAVTLGDRAFVMRQGGGGRPEPMISQAVRGVVISRRPVSVTEWIAELASAVREQAAQDVQARAALTRLLLG
jgi:hypothetical protein